MPFDPMDKPEKEMARKEFEALRGQWEPAVSYINEAYDFYFGDYSIWKKLFGADADAAADRPDYRSGMSTAIIDHFVDAQLAMEPRFKRRPFSDSSDERDRANRIEKGLQAVFHDAILWQPYLATKVNGKQLAICNYTQLGTFLDTTSLSGPPTQKGGERGEDFDRREWEWERNRHTWNPVRIEVPRIGEVLMDPLVKIPTVSYRYIVMFSYDLKDLLSRKRSIGREVQDEFKEGDPYEEIRLLERWTPHWYTLMREDGSILYSEKNSLGFQPFGHTWGGSVDLKPIWTGHDEGVTKDYVRQAMLFSVMDDILMFEQAMVAQQNLLQRAAWAKKGSVYDASEAAEQDKSAYLQGNQDDWWIEKVPILPAQNFSHKAEIDQLVEYVTYSRQEAGFHQSGIDTATQAIISFERSSRKAAAFVMQMNHLYAIAGSNILKILHRVKEEYGVDSIDMGEERLRASDLRSTESNPASARFHIEVSFENPDTVTFLQEKQDARQELMNQPRPLISRQFYHRIARHEDETSMEDQIDMDLARMDPRVAAEYNQAALRNLGFLELADQEEARNRLARMVRPDGQTPLFGGQAPGQAAPVPTPQPQNGRTP
jgi:hypothetical protein